MKTYFGFRDAEGIARVKIKETNRALPLRLDLRRHSPTGFEWGYGGSGPAQLALALLADALGNDHLALQWHQPFKFAVVAGLAHSTWTLTVSEVVTVVKRLEAEADEDTPA